MTGVHVKIEDGFYTIPLLPRHFAEKIKGIPRGELPNDVRGEYGRLRSGFTAAKAVFASWVRKDRDSRMTSTAKAILLYLIECLNFDRGQCDPSHQAIADEIGVSVRQVERLIPQIQASNWIDIERRGGTMTNFYRLRVPVKKVDAILEYAESLRLRRADLREERKSRSHQVTDPTPMSDHPAYDPTSARTDDPTRAAAHDPTWASGKPMKETTEQEPLKKQSGSEDEGFHPRARAREAYPDNGYARAKGR